MNMYGIMYKLILGIQLTGEFHVYRSHCSNLPRANSRRSLLSPALKSDPVEVLE